MLAEEQNDNRPPEGIAGLAERTAPAGGGRRFEEAGRPAGEPAQLREAELAEALVTPAEGGHLIEVTLIRPGRSRNGNAYSPQLLRESISLFEGVRAFADHARDDSLPERSVRDLVGYYRNARIDEYGKVRAQLHLVPGNDWLFGLIAESQNNPNLCGLSVDAAGTVEGQRGNRTVIALHRVDSVDIVTRPAAGGQFDRILASYRPSPLSSPKENTIVPEPGTASAPTAESAPAAQTPPAGPPSGPPTQQSPDLAQLIEQLQRERNQLQEQLARVSTVLAPASPPTDPNTELTRLAEEIKRDRDLARCENLLAARLQEAGLPLPVAKKIRQRFAGRVFEPSVLETQITEERDTLSQLTALGQVTGLGYEKPITAGMNEYDQIQAAMDALFDVYESEAARRVPRFSGIREAFRVCTGVDAGAIGAADRPLKESLRQSLVHKVQTGRLAESEAHLLEADVTTSSFSYLLGTSMNKRLLSDYMAWPSEWQKFCSIVAVKDFKLQDRIRLGAFGSLSSVAEDASYTTLTLADTHATYTPTKRGNLVQITRETIVNDDLYAIKQIPQKLAVAAAFTLAEFVYNLLAPSFGAIYDTHNLFDSINHLNTGIVAASLGTANSGTALSSAALQTAVIAMRKQKNAASKPIGLKPRYLLVPPDLEFSAMTILKSAGLPGGANNDINPMMGYAEPIVAPQLNSLAAGPASTTSWIAVADPRVIDTIEIGFVGGQANPVLLIQDMPLYGLNFTQDTISYKVRHEYGGAVVDYRGFYLGNN